jgi:phage tail-like protein
MTTPHRAATPGLASPLPFIERLPALYAQDDFTGRFTAAFDDVLAPVHATLDCIEAYWDARLAPTDFLDLLAGWVGADTSSGPTSDVDTPSSPERQRDLVANAVRLHSSRGTVHALAEQIRLLFDIEAEISDNCGASWSATPGSALPGTPDPFLTVRIPTATPADVPLHEISAVVDANRPAHVPATVDVITAP